MSRTVDERRADRPAHGQAPAPARDRQAAGRSTRVTSQEQLVDLLGDEGVRVHPGHRVARPRRPRRDQGAGRRRRVGLRHPRAAPATSGRPSDHLRRVFGDWVVEVAPSGNLVVLRTPPGSAHVVGSALDRADLPDVARHRRRRRHPDRRRGRRRRRHPHRPTALAGPWPGSGRHSTRRTRDEQNVAKRVVLAYSGGLDTSVAVRWMIDELGVEVIAPRRRRRARRPTTGTWCSERALAAGARRGRRRRRPRRSSPRTSSRPRSRPTPCTRAATRWCRRCPGR